MTIAVSSKLVELTAGLLSLFAVAKLLARFRRRGYTTPLLGPPSPSWIFGIGKKFFSSEDPAGLHAKWAEQYGPVFQIPGLLGENAIVLADPKACAHFHAKETIVYLSTPFRRKTIRRIFGKGLLVAEGESHKRQRRALNPAFSNSSLRNLTSIFYDSAYKVKDKWDNIIFDALSDEVLIDVQEWANKISLESIGLAAFSHKFGALDGHRSAVLSIFEGVASEDIDGLSKAVVFLTIFFPWMAYLPTRLNKFLYQLRAETQQIASSLLRKDEEQQNGQEMMVEDKSALGLLVKSEREVSEATRHSRDEIIAQINTLIFAGYETTSITMTWSLVEICKQPHIQQTLRRELVEKFAKNDPTWDDLWYNLPYLDAVCLETLRLHPPQFEVARMAGKDDIIPLSRPVTTATGEIVSSISVAKGTSVRSAIGALNRDKSIWGPDADEFIPERWLGIEKSDSRVKEIQGYKHLMTFGDGPRNCLGKSFALAEWKATLAVLLRNYTFELPDGPDTKIGVHMVFLNRPKLAGRVGAEMLMKVRKFEG